MIFSSTAEILLLVSFVFGARIVNFPAALRIIDELVNPISLHSMSAASSDIKDTANDLVPQSHLQFDTAVLSRMVDETSEEFQSSVAWVNQVLNLNNPLLFPSSAAVAGETSLLDNTVDLSALPFLFLEEEFEAPNNDHNFKLN